MIEETKTTEMQATDQKEAREQLIVGASDNPEYIIEGEESQKEEIKKVNSFHTILSIWNSMIGSSTVVLPYNVYKSGIIPAIFLSIIYGFICFYTCKIYCDFGEKDPDFSITVEKYFSVFGPSIAKIGKNTQFFFCTFIVTGALFIYFLIMTQNIYPTICLILNKIGGFDMDSEDLKPEFGRFSLIYLGIVLCFCLFPFIIKKDVGFLVKLSSFGIYFISALIVFEIYTGISSFLNTDFDFEYIKNNNQKSNKRHLKLFGEDPSMFAGTLSMGYFCHTTILPILKANKNQENNIRDLILGYIFVGLTFSLSGIFGYNGFSGKNFGIEFEENWFMFFDEDDYLILVFRLLNVFQLFSVFPILAYVVRIQIFNFFYGNDYPSKRHIIIYGISLLSLCLIVLYFCYNILGKFLAIIGASTTLILLYSFPPIVKTINYFFLLEDNTNNDSNNNKNIKEKELNEEKEEEKELKEEKEKEEEEKEEKEIKEEKEENEENKEIKDEEIKKKNKIVINEVMSNCDTDENIEKLETDTEENESQNKKIEIRPVKKFKKIGFKDILFILGQSSIIVIGIATVVFQFTNINFFNVHLKDE